MSEPINEEEKKERGPDFIRQIILEEQAAGKCTGKVTTRFPPEPNGYLHIGHAKSICLNSGIAEDFNGTFNLRFDDTNPEKENEEYVNAIIEDVRWLGADFGGTIYHASDYFDQIYLWALELINEGKAYVDDLSADEISEYRGPPTKPGRNSPYRERSIAENLDLFERMRKGEYPDGAKTLRAKIDMANDNFNMRDPVMYRIKHAKHHRSGEKWCIYPMYDFAHGYEDSLEGITHSICTLEFENHRPLYNWFIENVSAPCHPRQIEFARLNISYTLMSKRKLLELVNEKFVSGWDDPRMPTICGFRRRGYTPAAIKRFCREIGISKVNSMVDIGFLQFIIREELNQTSNRAMAVLDPLKVVIENYPEGKIEAFTAENNPENPASGTHPIEFSREIFIEREDFMEEPSKKYFRLAPGKEVRLKYTYYITCREVIKDSTGKITELRCVYDPESRGGDTPDGRKVKGTLHWVSSHNAVKSEVRMYDHLFTLEDMDQMEEGKEYKDYLNPDSLKVMKDALVEPFAAACEAKTWFQFLRNGYFFTDPKDHTPGKPVFNLTVKLKDTWAKEQKKTE